ncbi:MAG: glutamine synthetase type III, partial [Alphaproteobacteria bacterium]
AEAEKRGLFNLRTTPDALGQMVEGATVATLGNYGVLDDREMHARYEIALEQYVITVNTEAETAADIAATMILPAAVRYLGELDDADLDDYAAEVRDQVKAFIAAIKEFQAVNLVHPEDSIAVEAMYMRDKVIPAMQKVRTIADALERIVPDNLWPLPKYSEILFIK